VLGVAAWPAEAGVAPSLLETDDSHPTVAADLGYLDGEADGLGGVLSATEVAAGDASPAAHPGPW